MAKPKRPAHLTPVEDPRLPDLVGKFRRYAEEGSVENSRASWGPELLHVSDLPQCPAAVAARRRGEPLLPFSAESVVSMTQGNAWEALVMKSLHYGGFLDEWELKYQAPVTLWISDGELVARPHKLTEEQCGSPIATGKTDFVLSSIDRRFCVVLDTKWLAAEDGPTKKTKVKDPTTGRTITEPSTVKAPPSYSHLVQCASYGLAHEAEFFAIFRGGRALDITWYRTEPWRNQITSLVKQQLALTDPNAIAWPPAVPPTWLWSEDGEIALSCYSCDWGGCENNRNPMRDRQGDVF